MDLIKEDIKEIKADLKELIKQGAVHNVLLQTHEARSLALQAEQRLQAQEMVPVKHHVEFVNKLGKTLLAILTGVAIYAIGRLLF